MFDYSMEHIFSYSAMLDANMEVIGPTPNGFRMNVYVTGGEMSGPKVQGKVRPVGADWLTIREDGVAILDVRATMETHDGALIYCAYQGVADVGEDGYARFMEGNAPDKLVIRAVPRFMTSHPDYLWLNRLQCINIGEADLQVPVVNYDVYALR